MRKIKAEQNTRNQNKIPKKMKTAATSKLKFKKKSVSV